jgi:hypothetical protein
LDCAEASSQSEESEDELHQENEVTPSTSTTVNGVSYQVSNLQLRQMGEDCSYKKSMDINVSITSKARMKLLLAAM